MRLSFPQSSELAEEKKRFLEDGKMKRVLLMGIFFCSVFVHADIVPLTRDYVGQIDSFFKRGNDIYSLSGTTTNGYVQRFNLSYPYAGGMAINNPAEMMSPDAIQVVTLFRDYSASHEVYAKCWGRGYVEGTIEAEETPQCPFGTRS